MWHAHTLIYEMRDRVREVRQQEQQIADRRI
jgi:hypothetical protein